MAKPLYVLLKNSNTDPILSEILDNIAFKALKESLIKPLSLGRPSDQILSLSLSFFFFVYEKEGNALGILIEKQKDHH